jgi:hypothetical protein
LFLWQTQTGALLAVAAALIGAAAILQQTRTTQRLEEVRRERRAVALRAVLPLTLTELSAYAASCAEINATLLEPIYPLRQPGGSSGIMAPSLHYPPLPVGLVDRLIGLIEASEQDHARPLIILLRWVQIQHARCLNTMRRARDGYLPRLHIVDRMIDAAEIYARCEKLFAYSRGTANAPAAAITADDVKKALFLLETGLSDLAELEEKIGRMAQVGQNGAIWPEV